MTGRTFWGATLWILAVVGCGGQASVGPEPGPAQTGYAATWTIEIAESSRMPFSVRLWVNHGIVFSDSRLSSEHSVRVNRNYQPGPQVVEAEILDAAASSGEYSMRVLLSDQAGASIFGEHAGPTRLEVGQRLELVLYLLPPKGH